MRRMGAPPAGRLPVRTRCRRNGWMGRPLLDGVFQAGARCQPGEWVRAPRTPIRRQRVSSDDRPRDRGRDDARRGLERTTNGAATRQRGRRTDAHRHPPSEGKAALCLSGTRHAAPARIDRSDPRGGEHERTILGSRQESRFGQTVQQPFAGAGVHSPQSLGLRPGQPQPRHLEILGPSASQHIVVNVGRRRHAGCSLFQVVVDEDRGPGGTI